MPVRSKVALLPKELRNELERRIVERAFSGYEDLSKWLQAQGYQIAKDSVQRYGSKLQRKIEALDRAAYQAQAIAEAAPGGGEAMMEAAIRLVQQKVFSVLVEAEELKRGDMARLTRTVADLGRITIAWQRRADEVRSRLEQHKQAAGERVAKSERKGGLSKEAYHAIRNALLGIDPFAPGDDRPKPVPPTASPANDSDAAEPAKSGTPRP